MLLVAAAALGVVALPVTSPITDLPIESPSTPPTAVLEGSVHVNAWEAGDEMVARCQRLSTGYRRVEVDLPMTGALNVWAAGNAAVARHFNHLLEVCPT